MSGIPDHAVKARDFIIDILFPRACVGCGGDDTWLCDRCTERFRPFPDGRCVACRSALPSGYICLACREETRLDRLAIAFDYESPVLPAALKALKYSFVRELGPLLAAPFLAALRRDPGLAALADPPAKAPTLVIPVPLAPRRLRWRGFNQAAFLAEAMADAFGAVYDEKSLIRTAFRRPQATLREAERRLNPLGQFRWAGAPLNGRGVILVDDIVTTGATLGACASALKSAGADQVIGAVLAKG